MSREPFNIECIEISGTILPMLIGGNVMRQGVHEDFEREDDIKTGSDRVFCFLFAVVFGVLAAASFFHQSVNGFFWLVPGLIFFATGMLRPAMAAPLNRLWAKLGGVLHAITNPIILCLLYAIAIVPTGLALQCARRCKKNVHVTSYWVIRNPPGPAPQSMIDPF